MDVARRKVLVILEGTIARTDRVGGGHRGADAAFYPGKVRAHGMNARVLTRIRRSPKTTTATVQAITALITTG